MFGRCLKRLCLVHRLLLFPVGQWLRPNNAAPSLQPHYRAFDATTGCSAPAPHFGTLALAVGAACGLSLHVIGVTKHRFSRSVRKSCPALWCRSGVDLGALRRVWPAAQAATAGSLKIGSSLNGAMVSSVM